MFHAVQETGIKDKPPIVSGGFLRRDDAGSYRDMMENYGFHFEIQECIAEQCRLCRRADKGWLAEWNDELRAREKESAS